MRLNLGPLSRLFSNTPPDQRELSRQLVHLLGFKPKHVQYYQLAFMHSSRIEEENLNNERLEFLGDAVLGAIIAEYLFKKYPSQMEGYLTEMRSRIVRRETMNNIALRMGLQKMVQYNQNDRGLSRSHIFGNALEALIGAVYLDQGFAGTRTFIIRQIVTPYIDLEDMAATDTNYKNQLLSWAQKQGHSLAFETVGEKQEGSRKIFVIGVRLNDRIIAQGSGFNKKDAGQVAAQEALRVVNA